MPTRRLRPHCRRFTLKKFVPEEALCLTPCLQTAGEKSPDEDASLPSSLHRPGVLSFVAVCVLYAVGNMCDNQPYKD